MAHGGGHGGFTLPFLERVEDFVKNLQSQQGVVIPFSALAVPFVVLVIMFLFISPDQTVRNFELTFFISPLWLPFLIGVHTWDRWVDHVRYAYNIKQQTVLLEIRVPRDTQKSPLSMETFFSNLHLAPGEGTWYKQWWLGRTRPWFSFEIVSLGGRVHLYVWTRKAFRHVVETYLYAQYPDVEIVEAVDYTRLIDPNHPPYRMWACEYKKSAPDPYPIKTYPQFSLDKQLKPEETTDPLANVLEFMGSLSPNEQLWIHIMIRYSKGERYKRKPDGSRFTWIDEANELIEEIREKTVREMEMVNPVTGQLETRRGGFPNPTKGQQEAIAALENNTGKHGFDVGIRSIYVAREGHFRDFIGNFVTQIFRPFGTNFQGLGPLRLWSESFTEMPWEDRSGKRREHAMHEALEFGRRRAYFHYPYKGPYMQMSTEELATLFHIPSSAVAAPNLPRIQSARTEAPSNLPT